MRQERRKVHWPTSKRHHFNGLKKLEQKNYDRCQRPCRPRLSPVKPRRQLLVRTSLANRLPSLDQSRLWRWRKGHENRQKERGFL